MHSSNNILYVMQEKKYPLWRKEQCSSFWGGLLSGVMTPKTWPDALLNHLKMSLISKEKKCQCQIMKMNPFPTYRSIKFNLPCLID